MAKYYYGLGRRKTSIASVRLFEEAGASTINEKTFETLYTLPSEKSKLNRPFAALELDGKKYMFSANVKGGGKQSQLEAVILGIARAFVELDPNYKKPLKDAGLLTRDPRMVERKKTGRRKARKSEQYSKR